MLPIPTKYNYNSNPKFPAPWAIVDGVILDATGKRVSAPGHNSTGYANLPATMTEAKAWVNKIINFGSRVWRAHKIEVPLKDNPTSHLPRFQMLLDACEAKGIPVMTEVIAEHPDNFNGALDRLSQLRLDNVVGISPYNERPELTTQLSLDLCKQLIPTALVFGSNSAKQGGLVGDVRDCHQYCDHRVDEGFFQTYMKDQWWNFPTDTTFPSIATEIGHMWPSDTRRDSEKQIVDILLGKGYQVIIPFALATQAGHYGSGYFPMEIYAMHNDPERTEAWRYLVNKMAGKPYWGLAGNSGFSAEWRDGERWVITSPGA